MHAPHRVMTRHRVTAHQTQEMARRQRDAGTRGLAGDKPLGAARDRCQQQGQSRGFEVVQKEVAEQEIGFCRGILQPVKGVPHDGYRFPPLRLEPTHGLQHYVGLIHQHESDAGVACRELGREALQKTGVSCAELHKAHRAGTSGRSGRQRFAQDPGQGGAVPHETVKAAEIRPRTQGAWVRRVQGVQPLRQHPPREPHAAFARNSAP